MNTHARMHAHTHARTHAHSAYMLFSTGRRAIQTKPDENKEKYLVIVRPSGRHDKQVNKRSFPPVQGLCITIVMDCPRPRARPPLPSSQRRVPHEFDLHFSHRHSPRPAAAAVPPTRRNSTAKNTLAASHPPASPSLVAGGGLPSLPSHTCPTGFEAHQRKDAATSN